MGDIRQKFMVSPGAVVQGTMTLMLAQVLGSVAQGVILASYPSDEHMALRTKVSVAIIVVLIIALIIMILWNNDLVASPPSNAAPLNPPVIGPLPSVITLKKTDPYLPHLYPAGMSDI